MTKATLVIVALVLSCSSYAAQKVKPPICAKMSQLPVRVQKHLQVVCK